MVTKQNPYVDKTPASVCVFFSCSSRTDIDGLFTKEEAIKLIILLHYVQTVFWINRVDCVFVVLLLLWTDKKVMRPPTKVFFPLKDAFIILLFIYYINNFWVGIFRVIFFSNIGHQISLLVSSKHLINPTLKQHCEYVNITFL